MLSLHTGPGPQLRIVRVSQISKLEEVEPGGISALFFGPSGDKTWLWMKVETCRGFKTTMLNSAGQVL